MILTAIRERITIEVVRWVPKGLYSAIVGWGARQRLPRPVRSPLYRTFSRVVGARLDEAELPVADYPTFGDFFARRLRPGARSVATDPLAVTAPCDGVLSAVGIAEDGRMIQAKGRDYSVEDLVLDDAWARKLRGGPYLTFYLSPRDYHRVHAPMAARWLGYEYLPGDFFPVNPLFSRSVDGIMTRNERVVFHFDSPRGAMALVMVGALAVSNIRIAYDGTETGRSRHGSTRHRVRLEPPREVERGDELGAFQLGSTVILIFEPKGIDLDAAMQPGSAVRFGEPIGWMRKRVDHASAMGIVS